MFRSDWRNFGKTIGLTSAAFFLLALLYVVGFYAGNASGFYDGQAERTASQYPSDTQRIIDECFKLPTRAATSECISEAHAASQENQRAVHDLKAQRDMSDWAWWVMIIGALQFFATIATLGFVKLTLDATLEAVKDTGDATKAMLAQNEISKYAQRPWIEVEVEKVSMSSSSETFSLTVDLILRNRGHTPALNILSRGKLIIRHGKQEIEGDISPGEDYTRSVHNLLPGGSGHNSIHPKMPADLIPKRTVRFGGQKVVDGLYFVPTLEIKVDYEWGDPIEHGRTIKRFSISAVDPFYHERDERLGIPITLGAIPVPPLKAIEVASPEIS